MDVTFADDTVLCQQKKKKKKKIPAEVGLTIESEIT